MSQRRRAAQNQVILEQIDRRLHQAMRDTGVHSTEAMGRSMCQCGHIFLAHISGSCEYCGCTVFNMKEATVSLACDKSSMVDILLNLDGGSAQWQEAVKAMEDYLRCVAREEFVDSARSPCWQYDGPWEFPQHLLGATARGSLALVANVLGLPVFRADLENYRSKCWDIRQLLRERLFVAYAWTQGKCYAKGAEQAQRALPPAVEKAVSKVLEDAGAQGDAVERIEIVLSRKVVVPLDHIEVHLEV